MEIRRYRIVAERLLKEEKPISIEKLAVLTNMPIEEIEQILREFNSLGFLENKDNFNSIFLTGKAKIKNS
jgi:predicted transcriptional regulator